MYESLIRFLNSTRRVFLIVRSSWGLVWLNRIEWTCQNFTSRTPVNTKVSAVVAGKGLLRADRKTPTITLTPALSPRHPYFESHTVRPNIGRLPSSSSRLSYQPGSTETRSTDRLWPRADGGFDTTERASRLNLTGRKVLGIREVGRGGKCRALACVDGVCA